MACPQRPLDARRSVWRPCPLTIMSERACGASGGRLEAPCESLAGRHEETPCASRPQHAETRAFYIAKLSKHHVKMKRFGLFMGIRACQVVAVHGKTSKNQLFSAHYVLAWKVSGVLQWVSRTGALPARRLERRKGRSCELRPLPNLNMCTVLLPIEMHNPLV